MEQPSTGSTENEIFSCFCSNTAVLGFYVGICHISITGNYSNKTLLGENCRELIVYCCIFYMKSYAGRRGDIMLNLTCACRHYNAQGRGSNIVEEAT